MAATDSNRMLDSEQLNDVDNWILDFLTEHEWATVNLMRAFYLENEGEISRQWLANRASRLREHRHLEKVLDTRTYRLVDDPRDE
jgi:hypothetical protein